MTVQKSLPPSGRRVSYSPTTRVAPYLAAEFVDKIVPPGPGYPNNILKTTALPATVKVSVPWDDDFYEDDIIILEWDGGRVTSSSYTITAQDELDKRALILDLPLTTTDDYDQTPHQLRYIIDWSDAGADSFGENQDSWVDTTAPGSPVLGRLTFPSVSPGDPLVITLDSLDASDNLIGLVPSYNGEWQGDLIEVYIETAGVKTWLTPGTRLPAGPIGIQPPSVAFSLAALEAAGDQDVHLLGYRVTDLAGNVSALSQEVAARFVLNDIPMNVPAPKVPLFDDDGIVDEADARVLIAEIPPITPVHVNDEIVLRWGTQVVASDFVTNTAADPLLRLPIPYSAVLNGGGGRQPNALYHRCRVRCSTWRRLPDHFTETDKRVRGRDAAWWPGSRPYRPCARCIAEGQRAEHRLRRRSQRHLGASIHPAGQRHSALAYRRGFRSWRPRHGILERRCGHHTTSRCYPS